MNSLLATILCIALSSIIVTEVSSNSLKSQEQFLSAKSTGKAFNLESATERQISIEDVVDLIVVGLIALLLITLPIVPLVLLFLIFAPLLFAGATAFIPGFNANLINPANLVTTVSNLGTIPAGTGGRKRRSTDNSFMEKLYENVDEIIQNLRKQ